MNDIEAHFEQFLSDAIEYTGDEKHGISRTWLHVCYISWAHDKKVQMLSSQTVCDLMDIYAGPPEMIIEIDWVRSTPTQIVMRSKIGWAGWTDCD